MQAALWDDVTTRRTVRVWLLGHSMEAVRVEGYARSTALHILCHHCTHLETSHGKRGTTVQREGSLSDERFFMIAEVRTEAAVSWGLAKEGINI